jgi:hypothetical protein
MKGRKLIPYAGKERGGDQRTYGHSSQRGVPKLPNGESKRQRRKLRRKNTAGAGANALMYRPPAHDREPSFPANIVS